MSAENDHRRVTRPRLRIIVKETRGYPTGCLRASSGTVQHGPESRKVGCETSFFLSGLWLKKTIEAHAAPEGARRTLSAHALPQHETRAVLTVRNSAASPDGRVNACHKKNLGIIVYFGTLALSRGVAARARRTSARALRRGAVAAKSAELGLRGMRPPRWDTHTSPMLGRGTWSSAHPSRSVAGRRCRGRRRAPLCGLVSQMARAATVSQRTGARYMNQ